MRIADPVISPDQRHYLAAVEGLVPRRNLARDILRHHPVGIAFEEEGRRHLEYLRHIVEPARRDADIAGLVLLHRLEGDADLAGKSALAQAELNAPQAHAPADIDVDRMRFVFLALNDHYFPHVRLAAPRAVEVPV